MLNSLRANARVFLKPGHTLFSHPHARRLIPVLTRHVRTAWTAPQAPPRNLVASDAQRRTIYALSTPPGKAGVAVVRISGPDALKVWKAMVRTSKRPGTAQTATTPEPWKIERCRIVQPTNESEQLDDGLAVYFRGPKSFTTEDVVELHLHSGRAIISSVLHALAKLPFCRAAEAGEFTQRAFLGGRMDLTQVEGLKDLINAETEGQRRIAMMAARGSVRARFDELRAGIIGCLANVEALIDFGEGEDIEEGVYEQARSRAQNLLTAIQKHLNDNRRGEIIRSAQREAAIVTPIPGTTRDILELSMDIGGLPIIVADTAGLRKTDDLVESIGIERARKAVQSADISLCVLSLPDALTAPDTTTNPNPTPKLAIPSTLSDLITPDTLILFNKSDLAPNHNHTVDSLLTSTYGSASWTVSLGTGAGTSKFLRGFGEALQDRFNLHDDALSSEDAPLITRERHRVHLESACRFLQAFLDTAPEDVVLGAEELRYAAHALGKVSGLIDVEDILDAVFKDFCIGK
ncbi:hypothetical protein DXG03_005310 [Asterophora parasitica]|uniref:tRNA modification GTPase TrmE n=1 Tax=Asterophora parasitica TaxID=117018 RepID=A0A9P7G940_9AGAR|nr:hypothetical protein DXG03_005310 [Asterophora parasitica]